MDLWSQDEAFWTMLIEAQAGDVLIGKDRDIYEFFHTFTGEGKDLLTGIYRSDGNGNPVTGNYQDFKLNNYYRGRTGSSYSPDCCFSWLGFIRWNEENGQKIPSFWLPPGATWRQTRMANWAIFAQDATWILTGAAVGWMLPEAVAAAEGLAKLAPITSFGTSILFDIVNYPKTYRNITGTQANDLTVTITYNHSVAEMVFREEYPGYWNYQDLWFK